MAKVNVSDIYPYSSLCFITIVATIALGIGFLGIVAFALVWAFMIFTKVPKSVSQYKALEVSVDKKLSSRPRKEIDRVLVMYSLPIIMSITVFGVFTYSTIGYLDLISYLFDAKKWWLDKLNQNIPLIKAHSDVVSSRGEILAKYYQILYALVFIFAPLPLIVFAINIKVFMSTPHFEERFYNKKHLYFVGRIFLLAFITGIVLTKILDIDRLKSTSHIFGYDLEKDDLFLIKGLPIIGLSGALISYSMFLVLQSFMSILKIKKTHFGSR